MEWRPALSPSSLAGRGCSIDTSTDASSSASDKSADGRDYLCGVLADGSAQDKLCWLEQGKKRSEKNLKAV